MTHDDAGCTSPVWTSGGSFIDKAGVQCCTYCLLPLYSDDEKEA